jgi:hypothetical protein
MESVFPATDHLGRVSAFSREVFENYQSSPESRKIGMN